jgi:nucleoside-diphosphate-sugar epimerase
MGSKTILVTGATGFTGHHFIGLAERQGYECIALTQSDASSELSCTSIVCDLLDYQELESIISEYQFDYVVHLAAIAFVGHGSVEDIYRTNVVGTTNLLDCLIKTQSHIKNVLVASSGNVYGNNTELPLSESSIVSPANDYGVSKLAMEYAASLRANKLPLILTRPFNYTGVGQHRNFLIPKITSAFRERQSVLELGNTDVYRDFTDVRDLCRAYLKLLESTSINGVFNVCSGKPISLRYVVDFCQEITGHEIEIQVNPDFVRKNEIKTLYGNDQKLREAIGGYRLHSFDQTIEWMLTS